MSIGRVLVPLSGNRVDEPALAVAAAAAQGRAVGIEAPAFRDASELAHALGAEWLPAAAPPRQSYEKKPLHRFWRLVQTNQMETFPRSRAQRPAGNRALGAAGELRLHHILRALLLSLLSVLLGRGRRTQARLYGSACHYDAEWLEEFPLPFPQAESPRPIRIRSIHDGTHMVIEHRIMYVFGPPPRRGMRNLARITPLRRPRIARAPPARAETTLHTPNPRQIPLVRGRSRTPAARRPMPLRALPARHLLEGFAPGKV